MSIFGILGGLITGVVVGIVSGNPWVGFSVGVVTMNALDRAGKTPKAEEQGVQREMVFDPAVQIPVVYGRTIVAPRLAYVMSSGTSLEKLYLVGVLSEGVVSAIEEIYLDGNCAVLADGTVRSTGSAPKAITGVDLGTPCRVHCEGHGFVTGDVVNITAGVGSWWIWPGSGDYFVTVLDPDHFTIPITATSSVPGTAFRRNPGYFKRNSAGEETSTPLVRFAKYLGTNAQDAASNPGEANGPTADSTMAVHDVPGWVGALSGLAYIVLEITYDADRFPDGIPEVTMMVKGRTVWDPRIAATAWSDNPILCYRDYLSDGARYGSSAGAVRYGLGIAVADIFDGASDAEGLRLLAEYCDESASCPAGTGMTAISSTTNAGDILTTDKAHGLAVANKVWIRDVTATPVLPDGEYEIATVPSTTTFTLVGITFSADGGVGGTVQKLTTQVRYSCNGVIDTGRTLQENLNAILSSCRGFPVQEGGRWSAVITRSGLTPSSFTLDVNSIVGDWEFSTADTADVPNLIIAKYAPRFGDIQTVAWPPTTVTNPYLAADAYVPNVRELELPMTQDYYQAQRIARCVLEEARAALYVAVTAQEGALVLSVGDLVPVTHATPAWTAKNVWVVALGILPDAHVRVLAKQYLSTAYDEELTDDAPGAGTALPLPWYVAPPTALVLTTGTGEMRIKGTWTPSPDALVWRYEIEARRSDEGTWRGFGFVDAATPTAFIAPVLQGETWYVRVRAVRRVGTRSEWLTGNHAVSLIGASVFTYSVTADASGVDYALVFGVNCEGIELYTIAHAAPGGANPETSPVYLAARIWRPASGQVIQRIATTGNYYRRTRIISYSAAGLKGQESAVIETQAIVSGGGPNAAPNTLADEGGTSTTQDISWVNGDATAVTRVWVDGMMIYPAPAGNTTYTITGLSPGQTIQVDIDHFKDGQASAKNGVVEMTTEGVTLDTPTGFAVHGVTGGPPYLWAGWTMGANAAGAQTVLQESEAGDFSDAVEVSDASPTPPGATSLASAFHNPYAIRTFRAKHTRTGSADSGWSDTDVATYGGEDV